jgi:phage tail-like protein
VLILDRRHQVVYAHEPGAPLLRRWFAGPADAPTSWLRLAADADGTLLLWDGGGETVDRVDHNGNRLGSVRYRDVRERFKAADKSRLPPPPSRARPAALPVLHRTGKVTRQDLIAGVAPAPSRVSKGSWLSSWIDSGIYDCQWNLLELSLGELPPGSRITVRTRTANVKPSLAEIAATTTPLEALASWATGAPIVAPSQPSDEELAKAKRQKMLVLSGPGQYLQLLVELAGTGIESPVITSIRIRYPRESYLQYLPAIYSEPEDQRRFLDRYLAIMETSWTELEQLVAGFERYLDPTAVPAGAPMRYLASWLALRLEGTWDEAKNRMLLEAVPRLLSRWGTREGLRAWVRVYLAAMSGLEPEMIEQAELPGIEESFVERRRLLLGRGDTATLCAADGLWSPSVERRLQVGVFDRLGDVELVSVGDPELDLFRHYAHGFRVYVPSAWVRGPDEEALLRRAIEAQRPAHTSYELVLVEPRFRVGVQSTVELDTVVGDPVMPPLACPGDDWSRGTLGFDTVLGCGSDRTALGGSDLILA